MIDLLAENPYCTIKRVARRLNVAYTTAQRAVEQLESLSILSQVGATKRDRVFCARALMGILDEPAMLRPGEER
ncbi:MAG: winged helix-turn-helix transcriptional regulator [Armatimonadetes bacterium]|nr:winged helix-turn-helix transcriptional regulator [Armatimonadota bacterium]